MGHHPPIGIRNQLQQRMVSLAGVISQPVAKKSGTYSQSQYTKGRGSPFGMTSGRATAGIYLSPEILEQLRSQSFYYCFNNLELKHPTWIIKRTPLNGH
ncbi:hypothetical protein BVC80_1239g2 [Macleaya cordata]|uniref:Uncharacterized protein n=1 Tax=Macleaya cordata TaxID=56857 RepID=A0A200R2D9_MACCD|nr:hypothetical protein BVC80_1239g2 [Macleaya cordata]